MGDYHRAALRIAQMLAAYPNVTIRPNPPQTNMLHAFIRVDADVLTSRVQRIAREHDIFTIGRLGATVVPDVHKWEVSCGDATLALTDAQVRTAFDGLFLA